MKKENEEQIDLEPVAPSHHVAHRRTGGEVRSQHFSSCATSSLPTLATEQARWRSREQAGAAPGSTNPSRERSLLSSSYSEDKEPTHESGERTAAAVFQLHQLRGEANSSKPTAAPLPCRTPNPCTVPPHAASLLRNGAPHDADALRAVRKRPATTSSPAPDEAAPQLHAHAAKLGLDDSHRGVRDALVALYLACGRRGVARAIFAGDPRPDVVSSTSMVTGHARLGLFREAATFTACVGAEDLALAREVHRRVLVTGVALDVVVCNALVDMYAKCADVAASLRCFRTMASTKNVVTWNTMISAHARAGEPLEALALFREMLLQQQSCSPLLRPDNATFVVVLSPDSFACVRIR